MKTSHSRHAPASGARRFSVLACAGALACGLAAGSALPAHAQTPAAAPAARAPVGPVKIDPGVLLKFIRSTLIALDQANKTGNYSVLRDLGSPAFQQANSQAHLAELFAGERQGQFDLSNVAILSPTVTSQPEINADGLLHFAGYFPAGAQQLRFEFLFQAAGTVWRLFGLSVNIVDAAAPAAAAAPPAAAQPAALAPAVAAPAPQAPVSKHKHAKPAK